MVRRCHGQAVFRAWVEERQPGDIGGDRLVVVVDGELEVDRATRRRRGRGAPVPSRCGVAASGSTSGWWRSRSARRRRRTASTRSRAGSRPWAGSARPRCRAGRSRPSRGPARRSPSARSCRRARGGSALAPDERPVVVVDALEHPAEAELLGRDAVVVGVGEPARGELDVDEDQAGLDPGHQQGLLAEGPQAVAGSRPR